MMKVLTLDESIIWMYRIKRAKTCCYSLFAHTLCHCDFADWELLKGLKLLHVLFTTLSKKESNVDAFSHFIETYDVSTIFHHFTDTWSINLSTLPYTIGFSLTRSGSNGIAHSYISTNWKICCFGWGAFLPCFR